MEAIARSEAARASERDQPGWLCLADGISQWISKKGYIIQDKYDNGAQNPVFLEWDWLMQFKRFREQYVVIIQPEYLFSPAAQKTLASVLEKDGAFAGEGGAFDHISLPWDKQRIHAYQNRSLTMKEVDLPFAMVGGLSPLTPDGLLAAVANVTIFAIAAGKTFVTPQRVRQVCIHRVAFFIHDGFEFEGDQPLGWWNCENLQFSALTGTKLTNRDFRNFRERTGYGCDFRIMSHPQVVWEGKYCYDDF